ncbi:selenoneine biosynthesis selenosugar synthase SenB [Herbaspirillum sp. ST 5-3]|uniref:selenoneine biosynthesis selenosugar synthase SenB n=1 Tax=Oxalobacteraceae TaxID=75682 RepID=UPI0010A38D18|nr:selenoneine biosynthesis selenosugar synthase SenB [Herbaspirillum sp. ST 5-3]
MSAQVVIVTPRLADANNGNWRTAQRWGRFLAGRYRVRLVKTWPDEESGRDDAMIALHARRSAESVAAWYADRGSAGLGLVLTGTDLYRDIQSDVGAQRSLTLAQELVVLQPLGKNALPAEYRGKTRAIFQSTPPRQPLTKTSRHLRVVMVGHLRPEKSPETLFAAARLLGDRDDIFIDHIGGALDSELANEAAETQAACPNYRWLGNLPHAKTRDRIQRAHLLVHCSRMEGGAHVVIEALTSGTPVLASRIDGNSGLLGEDYGGFFGWNDSTALVALLTVCRSSQNDPQGLLHKLTEQARSRSALFSPEAERKATQHLADDLLG